MAGEWTVFPDKRSISINTLVYLVVLAVIVFFTGRIDNIWMILGLYAVALIMLIAGYFNIKRLLSRRPSIRLSNDGVYVAGAYDLLVPWDALRHAVVKESWRGARMGIGVDQASDYFKDLERGIKARLTFGNALRRSEITLSQLYSVEDFQPVCDQINARIRARRGGEELQISDRENPKNVFADPIATQVPDIDEAQDALRAAFRK